MEAQQSSSLTRRQRLTVIVLPLVAVSLSGLAPLGGYAADDLTSQIQQKSQQNAQSNNPGRHTSGVLLNATPSLPQSAHKTVTPTTPSTTPGSASAASTAPPEATPQKPNAASGMPGVGAVPAPLVAIERSGKNIYAAARSKNFAQAQQQLRTLRGSYQHLAVTVNRSPSTHHLPSEAVGRGGATGQLASTISLLARSLQAKNALASMDYANQVILAAANLSSHYNAHVPVSAVLLGSYAREIDIWAMKKDMAKLGFTAKTITATWKTLRPTVMAHGGGSQAAHFDSQINRLNHARSTADYAHLAPALAQAADQIEGVFQVRH